jgi:hypothetical protein
MQDRESVHTNYRSEDSWQGPLRAGYTKVAPLLDQVENFDATRPNAAKEVDALHAKLELAHAGLKVPPSVPGSTGTWVQSRVNDMFTAYNAYLKDLRFVCTFHEHSATREEACGRVSFSALSVWLRSQGPDVSTQQVHSRERQISAIVKKMDEVELRWRLMQDLETPLSSCRAFRSDLENTMKPRRALP